MAAQHFITAYCKIKNHQIYINGQQQYVHEPSDTVATFLKTVYKNNKVKYPKFYKMDTLCKLAFLSAELLLKQVNGLKDYAASDVMLLFANASSSMHTDVNYCQTISDKNNYFPSPALFTYTLPNIMMGEISIRHQFQGENGFFIFNTFEPVFISKYINTLLDTQMAKACIAGWINVDVALSTEAPTYESFLYIVEQASNKPYPKQWVHTPTELLKLYEA